jgi:hypothetical protein
MVVFFTSVLRGGNVRGHGPAGILRLLLQDCYFEVLVELFQLVKVHHPKIRQIFSEHLDEFRHMSLDRDLAQRQLKKRLAFFLEVCIKHVKSFDFNQISLQMVGAFSEPQNLREILAKMSSGELKLIFATFKLPVPKEYLPSPELLSQNDLMINILIKMLTRPPKGKIEEVGVYPCERDVLSWDFKHDDFTQAQYGSLKELLLYHIDRLLKQETQAAETLIETALSNVKP